MQHYFTPRQNRLATTLRTLAIACAVTGGGMPPATWAQALAEPAAPPANAAAVTTNGLPDMTRIAAKLAPSVVNISVRGVRKVSTAGDAAAVAKAA